MSVYGASATKDRTGWFFGLTGPQSFAVLMTVFPIWLAMAWGRWLLLLGLVPACAVITVLICVPVRGHSALQWIGVMARLLLGQALGWSTFQSRAAAGDIDATDPALHRTDLPGVLQGIQIHDGPPMAGRSVRPALIQNCASRTWAATGRVVHPGIGMSSEEERHRMAAGLSDLLEAVSTATEVQLIAIQVRTVPDDGTERAVWVQAHRRPEPALSRQLHADLEDLTAGAAVRSEAFVTVVVAEDAMSRSVRRAGRGLTGRARALYNHLEEIESRLTGTIGCTEVVWLDTASLATAIRTGFEPGDAPLLAPSRGDSLPDGLSIAPPLAAVGPTLATTALRWYRHGNWTSVASTILLPRKGAMLGALARALVPSHPGERRALTVFFRPISHQAADRATGRAEMSAAMASELRRKVGRVERAKDRRAASRLTETDDKLDRGRALVKISSAICITVPDHWDIHDGGRRLDTSIRLSGFTPLPLDGAHDAAFAAATIPLGTGLPRLRK